MEPIEIPVHLDEPKMVLIFPSDQFVVFTLAFTAGLIFRELLAGIIVGVGLAWLFSKFRDAVPDGYVAHALYWYTGFPLQGRCVFNPFIRMFVG